MAGLYPVDCTIFQESDFAPSQASSVNAHILPSPFLTEFPSSDAEDRSYMPSDTTDSEDMASLPRSAADNGMISDLLDTEQEIQAILEEMHTEDLPGQEINSGAGATEPELDEVQLEDPVSGCVVALDNLEREIMYMMQSATMEF
jgi:hypothetical protein